MVIFWLQQFGFEEIEPIQASKKLFPDFLAKSMDRTFAIEVFCLTHANEQPKNESLGVYVNFIPGNIEQRWDGEKWKTLVPKIEVDFLAAAERKKRQLDAVDVDAKLLLCVINSSPVVSMNDYDDMLNHAKYLYSKLSWGEPYLVGLLTGANINGKLTDVVFPAL